jgi:hypothetical protein
VLLHAPYFLPSKRSGVENRHATGHKQSYEQGYKKSYEQGNFHVQSPENILRLPALYVGENAGGSVLHSVQRKIFWLLFTFLSVLADFMLPMWWALGATIPIGYVCWWFAYRSDLF